MQGRGRILSQCLVPAAVALVLGACSTTSSVGPPPDLSGTSWTVTRIDGRAPLGGELLTADFGVDGRINGDSGCNGYSGPYIQNDSTVRIGELLSTRRACVDDNRQAQESRVLRILQGANTVRREGDGRVSLSSSSGSLMLSPVAAVVVASPAPPRDFPRDFPDDLDGRRVYDCSGTALTVDFDHDHADISWSNGSDVLVERPASSGFYYESRSNTLHGRGNDVTWTPDGRSPRVCQELR